MRHIKTFILRTYTDPHLREQICGDLQALPGRETYAFKNSTELFNLLCQFINEEVQEAPIKTDLETNFPG